MTGLRPDDILGLALSPTERQVASGLVKYRAYGYVKLCC